MIKLIFLYLLINTNVCFSSEVLIDKVSAIFNNEAILQSEINLINKINNINNSNNILDNIISLDEIIVEKMNYQLAIDKGILINDLRVDYYIDNIAKSKFLTRNKFLDIIKNNNIDINYYRDFIRKKITVDLLYNLEIRSKIDVYESEICKNIDNIDSSYINSMFYKYCLEFIKIPVISDKHKLDSLIKFTVDKVINNKVSIKTLLDTNEFTKFPKNIEFFYIKDKNKEELPNFLSRYIGNESYVNDIIGPVFTNNYVFISKISSIVKNNIINENVKEVIIKNIFINMRELNSKNIIHNIFNDINKNNTSFNEILLKHYNRGIIYIRDLSWRDINLYTDEFRNKLLSLKPNEVSKPFISDNNWHILKLIRTRSINYIDHLKYKISYNDIYNKKFNSVISEWINNNKNNFYIEIVN
ncbi:chaperone SurA [endosymbiont of Sipalinus gigas]|uniref:peptidylprolyl isomerase n=1 Tax=endosymbiont of Sipalinus gigas TaxID=1972134 RepID=UPI000DC6E91B|nr:peptidylprolyl isomerase [endosymbiont of Sipalinus gigas]BBA85352.1 chaperone SurA [endosymbiont of Sipalinus gigas]